MLSCVQRVVGRITIKITHKLILAPKTLYYIRPFLLNKQAKKIVRELIKEEIVNTVYFSYHGVSRVLKLKKTKHHIAILSHVNSITHIFPDLSKIIY